MRARATPLAILAGISVVSGCTTDVGGEGVSVANRSDREVIVDVVTTEPYSLLVPAHTSGRLSPQWGLGSGWRLTVKDGSCSVLAASVSGMGNNSLLVVEPGGQIEMHNGGETPTSGA